MQKNDYHSPSDVVFLVLSVTVTQVGLLVVLEVRTGKNGNQYVMHGD